MIKIMTEDMKKFLTVGSNEEPVDQPVYHIQSYGTAGATSFTFFNVATGSATNGLSDTNMDSQSVLSAGKRFAVFSIALAYFAPSPMQFNAAGAVSPLNDANGVLQGIGNVTFQVLDKTYLQVAPLAYLPAGFGTFVGGASYQRTQGTPADGNGFIAPAANGMPIPTAVRRLRVPVPIPQQVKFTVTVNFPTAITVGVAGRIGCFLDGILIRARQ